MDFLFAAAVLLFDCEVFVHGARLKSFQMQNAKQGVSRRRNKKREPVSDAYFYGSSSFHFIAFFLSFLFFLNLCFISPVCVYL